MKWTCANCGRVMAEDAEALEAGDRIVCRECWVVLSPRPGATPGPASVPLAPAKPLPPYRMSSSVGLPLRIMYGALSGMAILVAAIFLVSLVSGRVRNEPSAASGTAAQGRWLSLASLGQIAESPEEMRRLCDAASRASAKGGMPIEEAVGLVRVLSSADALGDVDFFAELGATGLVAKPATMARAAARLQASMGVHETGDMRALVSKALAAAAMTPHAPEDLLHAAAGAGTLARALHFSDEEVLAAIAITSRSTSSAAEAGAQLEALLEALLQHADEFRGLGLLESLQKIQRMHSRGPEGAG